MMIERSFIEFNKNTQTGKDKNSIAMFIFVGEADTCIDHRYMFMHKYDRVLKMMIIWKSRAFSISVELHECTILITTFEFCFLERSFKMKNNLLETLF